MASNNPAPLCTCGEPDCPVNIADRIFARLNAMVPNAAWSTGPQLPQRRLIAPEVRYTNIAGIPIV